jgi:TRAP-type C4-dicarboxylate transport system permease small subunit
MVAAAPTGRMTSFLRALVRSGEALGAAATWLIMLVVVYDVTARALGHPTLWALEVSGYLMVAASVMAAGETLHRKGHFEVRLFVDMLPARLRHCVDRTVDVISALFVLAMTYGSFQLLVQSYAFGFRSPTLLSIPLIIPQAVLSAGLVLLAVAYLARVFEKSEQRDEAGAMPETFESAS